MNRSGNSRAAAAPPRSARTACAGCGHPLGSSESSHSVKGPRVYVARHLCAASSSPHPPHPPTSPPHDHVTHHVTTLGRGAGSVFHARCCICADCGADLTVGQAGQVVLGADRSLRCVGCEKRRRGDVCDSCGGVLMEHFVAALGGRFHDTCVLQGVSLFRDLAPPCAHAAPRGAPTNDARKHNNSYTRSPLPTPHKPHTTTNPSVAFGARRAPLCSAQARRAASRAPTGTCTVLCATGGARAALPPPPPPLPPGPLLQAQSKPPSAALRRRRACVGRAPSPHCNMKWTQSGAAVVTALRPPPLLRKQSPSRHAAAAAAAGTAAVAPGLRSARAATTAIAAQQEEGRKQ